MTTVKATGSSWMVKLIQKKDLITVAYYKEGRQSCSSTVTQKVPLTTDKLQSIANRLLEQAERDGIQRIYMERT